MQGVAMSRQNKKYDSCVYIFILAIVALLTPFIWRFFQLVYMMWEFFQEPDVISRLIYNVITFAESIAVFIVIFILLLMIDFFQRKHESFREEEIESYDRHITATVRPWVNRRREVEQFLSKSVLLDLAGKNEYRTKDVIVGDTLGANPSIPSYLLDPYYIPPQWEEVKERMEAYFLHFNEMIQPKILPAEDVKKLIDQLTLEFYEIHPFADGNKRLAVAIGEMIAMKYGYTITNKRDLRLYVQNTVVSGPGPGPAQGVAVIKKITD
jgi:hypothetical protein